MFGALFSEDTDDGSRSLSSSYVEPPQPPRSVNLLAGLDNQGATCYLNSLLQTLYMSPEFRQGIYSVDPYSIGLETVIEEEKAEEKEKLEAEKNAKKEIEKAIKKNVVIADGNIVSQLVSMGCSEGGSKKSAIAVNNKSMEVALEYYFSHADDDGFDIDEVDENDEENEADVIENQSNSTQKSGKKKFKVRRTTLELQRLFSQLQLADQRSMSTDLLTTKGFNFKSGDASVQHDVQELIVMLLDKLDHDLGGAKKPKKESEKQQPADLKKRFIPELFEVTSRTELTCLSCGATSGPPSETNKNFFVPIKGFPEMSAALEEVFKGEVRRTDCEACAAKRDKSCSLAVHRLPPLLWCSLMRFDYDWQKQQRTKINDSFEFPLVLDMRPHVPLADQSHFQVPQDSQASDRSVSLRSALRDIEFEVEGNAQTEGESLFGDSMVSKDVMDPLLYDLVGVVLHNGSGYSGHYVSLIRDQLCESRFQPDNVIPALPRKVTPKGNETKSSLAQTKSPTQPSVVSLPDMEDLQQLPPLALLRLLLSTCAIDSEKGTHVASSDTLATLVHKHAGRAWGKWHKKKHGSILNFVRENPTDFFIEGTAIALISHEPPALPVISEVKDSTDEDGWTSVTSKKNAKETSKEMAIQAEENSAQLARNRTKACLSAQRWGRWFQCNDSAVSPIPLSALSDAFAGRSSAYMLLYRSRSLGPLKKDVYIEELLRAPHCGQEDVRTIHNQSHVTPPEYWANYMKQWNIDLCETRKKYDASSHTVKLTFVCPSHISEDREGKHALHMTLKEDPISGVASEVAKPFTWDVDVRSSVADLREKVMLMLSTNAEQLGVTLTKPKAKADSPPQRASSNLKLHILRPHGPGYYLGTEVGVVPPAGTSNTGYAAVAKEASMTCGEALAGEEDLTVLCWNGLSVNDKGIDQSGVPPLEFFITSLVALSTKTLKLKTEREDLGSQTKEGSYDYSKLKVKKLGGSRGKAKPSPIVDVVRHKESMFVSSSVSRDEFVMMIASKYDIPIDRAVLNAIDSKGQLALLHSPATKNKESRGIRLETFANCELMIEDLDARGFFTQSLAETELLRRSRKRTVHVLNLVPPPEDMTKEKGDDETEVVVEEVAEDEEDGIVLTFGNFDDEEVVVVESEEKELSAKEVSKYASVGTEIEVDCEGEVSIKDFRSQLLSHLGLSSSEATTRLKFACSSAMGGEVIVDEELSLDDAKVEDGITLNLEVGARAKKGEVTLKFKLKEDPETLNKTSEEGTQTDPFRNQGQVYHEVTVKETCTVRDMKDLMCDLVQMSSDMQPMRLRLTNWAEEEGALVEEIDESASQAVDGSEVLLSIKDAGLVGFHECLLLEPGRVPRKGELELHFLLWNPPNQTKDAGGGSELDSGEGGAVASAKLVRTSCVHPLFCVETISLDQTLTEMKEIVASRLAQFLDGNDENKYSSLKENLAQYSTQSFELRMLRSDLLPGKWVVQSDDKTLRRFGLKTGSPLLIVPTQVPSEIPTSKTLDLFVTKRSPPHTVVETSDVSADSEAKDAVVQSTSAVKKEFCPLLWPPNTCSVNREGTFHTFNELKKWVAEVSGIEEAHLVIARHDFSKFTWTVLTPYMANTKKGTKGKNKAAKGGSRNVCSGPFSVKPGDLIGALDSREVQVTDHNNLVASEYLLATSFDTAADHEGREAQRFADKERKKQGSEYQKKRSQETVLNIGHSSYNWGDSESEEDES